MDILKKLFSTILLVIGSFLIVEVSAQDILEKRVNDLLSKMTLEEKVGQMTQLTLDALCKGKDYDENKEMVLDQEKLRKALVTYKVGSILNTGMYTLPREKWYELISEIQKVSINETRLKIPVLYGVDAIHGVTYTIGSTLFPQEINLAATWDPSLGVIMGSVTAYETRASNIPWNFSPVLDLSRQPLWSRVFETFGEDPYLSSEMAKGIVEGYQGNNLSDTLKVVSCLKHFVGYSNSRSGKDRTPIAMSEREMIEYYLVPFKTAIDNGALTVMINSTEINGTPVHADKHILTDILKGDLKFQGFSVSDWEDVIMLHSVHKIAASEKEAVKLAVNAGLDMSMTPYKLDFADHLVALVKEGEVSMDRIDDAVRRILRVKMKVGLFEHPITNYKYYPKFGSSEFAQHSYKAAIESITLLKNQNDVLPLVKGKKVFVTGVSANSLNDLNGAWTHTWQGVSDKYNPKDKLTILEALKSKVGSNLISYSQGSTYDSSLNTKDAIKKASKADYIVACLGELSSTEKMGDINDLSFEKAQLDLIRSLSKTGKPIILVLLESRPRLFTEVEPLVAAVIHAYRPSNEGGRAIADILYGDVNPSGKLPYTYPRFSGDFVLHDHKFSETRDNKFGNNAYNPLYDFGFGLSYTKFQYSALTIDKAKFNTLDSITVSVTVKNIGAKNGKEVVQLYSRDHFASITPSVRRLRAFKKIELLPGESKVITFTIDHKDLAFVNRELKWITEPGKFDIMIGPLKQEIEYVVSDSISSISGE